MNKNTLQGRRQTKQELRQRLLPSQVMEVVVIGGRKIYTTTTQTGWCIRKIIERIRRFFIYTTFAGRWWCIFFISQSSCLARSASSACFRAASSRFRAASSYCAA